MTGRWHFIDRIEPPGPQMVMWSAMHDPTSWDTKSESVKIAPHPRRGTRPLPMVASGTDAYGQATREAITLYLHWRKYKRMMRKMGRCR